MSHNIREDFSDLFKVQLALSNHNKVLNEIKDIISTIKPKLNDIHTIISQYHADTGFLFVNTEQHTLDKEIIHSYIEKLQNNYEHDKNAPLISINECIDKHMNNIKKTIEDFKHSIEKNKPTKQLESFDDFNHIDIFQVPVFSADSQNFTK